MNPPGSDDDQAWEPEPGPRSSGREVDEPEGVAPPQMLDQLGLVGRRAVDRVDEVDAEVVSVGPESR